MDLEEVNNRNSYSNIFKAIGLFGGVKIFQILISIIRSKVLAILIGPVGMGISNLFLSTTDLVSSISGCGLQTSSVRDVAQAHESKDYNRINVTITILRRLIWLTGLIGSIFTFVFSNALSEFAFGNSDYDTAFKALSVIILFNQLNVGQIALLQGTFHYKLMAKATLLGNAFSFIITIPIYYFLKTKGIVPALIIASGITLLMSTIYSRKVFYQKIKISWNNFWKGGKEMLTLGLALAAGAELSRVSGYIMNIFISHYGSLEQVGLYSVGLTLTNSYVFLVLSAMASDYVPRLSALCGNDEGQISAVNKQALLVSVLLTPLIVTFTVFSKQIIMLLYSSEFMEITTMVELMMFGMIFRGISWCISYSFVARGESKIFLISETSICIISLALHLVGYIVGGFAGVGIAVISVYIIYVLFLLLLSRKNYGFRMSRELIKIMIPCICFCGGSLLVSLLLHQQAGRYIIGAIFLLLSIAFCFIELDKRIFIKTIIASKLHR